MEMLSKISKLLFKKPFYGKSLMSNKSLDDMISLLAKCVNIEGDIIECGVYRGGSLIEISKKLKQLKSNKIIYGLDTFEGHPYTDKGTAHIKGLFSDASYIKLHFLIKLLKLDNIILLKGLFVNSFVKLKNKKFCFVHLDCDLYKSYKECFKFILPRLAKNAIVVCDDYNSNDALMANIAIEESVGKENIVPLGCKGCYYIHINKK